MKKILVAVFCLFITCSVFAQSADVISEILETEKATFGQVSYLAAVQQNLIDENASFDDAVKVLYENSLIPDNEDPQSPIPLVDIAYIYSRLWPVNGGLMYRLTKGSPRYAFKQFQADGIFTKEQEPGDFVSGAKALSIYTACVKKYSDFNIKTVSMESD